MRSARLRGAAGLTLVELLVVIAILSVLAALLLPVLAKARIVAMQAACMGNLKQMGVGLHLYAADSRGFVCVWPHGPWRYTLLPYLYPEAPNEPAGTTTRGPKSVFDCPASIFRTILNRSGYGVLQKCDSNQGTYAQLYSIASYKYARDGLPARNNYLLYWPVEPGTGWRNPARSAYVADGMFERIVAKPPFPNPPEIAWPQANYDCGTREIGVSDSLATLRSYVTPGATSVRIFADRHNGTNLLMADGHTQREDAYELYRYPEGHAECLWDAK